MIPMRFLTDDMNSISDCKIPASVGARPVCLPVPWAHTQVRHTDEFVIMPNHLHGIIMIGQCVGATGGCPLLAG